MFDRFLALMPAGLSILDVGCGSADPIGRYFIEQGYEITGGDSSKDLIDICQSKFPRQNWIIADMRKLSLERRFGRILAGDSFFHLCPEEQRGMFPVFRKHAAPKAALMFTSGPAYGEAIGTYRGEPLYHGSLDGTEYRLLLGENGFQVVSHPTEEPTDGAIQCGSRSSHEQFGPFSFGLMCLINSVSGLDKARRSAALEKASESRRSGEIQRR
jgi:SAM-dependent methyltransferase